MNDVPVHLLRETLQARVPAGPSPECLDADTVAAWADDTLGRDERRAAEAHAADCLRCQALVAAMMKTAPPTPARSWWRAPVIGWLVPMTAAAAALLVWMSLPGAPPAPSNTFVSRAIEQPLGPAQDAASSTRPDTPNQESPKQENSVPPPARQETAKPKREGQQNAARGRDKSADDGLGPAPATAAMAKALSEAAGGAAAPAAPPASPAAPATAAAPPPQQAAVDALTAAPPPVTVRRTGVPIGSANARTLFLDALRSTSPIVSSNPASRWRILANGGVQHSTDSGATWEVQSTGVTVMLTAGASPAPSICWLVGPEGIVLLSTDGRSWQRRPFPETVDLASVLATDDKNATVSTSDGRAFRTADGGQTWTRSSVP